MEVNPDQVPIARPRTGHVNSEDAVAARPPWIRHSPGWGQWHAADRYGKPDQLSFRRSCYQLDRRFLSLHSLNADTVYVADEGNPNLDSNGNLIPDPLAGLEKWKGINGTWQLLYTVQAGLNLYQPVNVPGYPVPTYTYDLCNITGEDQGDGSVTIYAISAQWSAVSGGEPDPTKLVKNQRFR